MRKTSLRIDDNKLILGKRILETLPSRINTLKEYIEEWGVLPKTQTLAALVRSVAIAEESRQGQAHIIVNGDDFMPTRSFDLNFGFSVPPRIFLYGRNQIFEAAERNEHIICFNRWVRGTEKRIKVGRIIFYEPSCCPDGYWAVGLPIEFRKKNNLINELVVKQFLKQLLKFKEG